MDYHRNQLREQRRRRALVDSSSNIDLSSLQEQKPQNGAPARGEAAGRSYTVDALEERQARVTDLIPKRYVTLGAWFVLAACLIAGVQWLSVRVAGWSTLLDAEALASLHPTQTGSLAGWLSSMLLAWGALGSVLIYTLRRHKTDDFRGRYRIWLSLAILLTLASLDAATALHNTFAAILAQLTGTTLLAGGIGWWMLFYMVGGGYLAVKILLDVRPSRASFTSLSFALLLYAASITLLFQWVTLPSPPMTLLARSSMTMAAHLFVLFGMGLYARHVFLDAQGEIEPRQSRRKKRSSDEDNSPHSTLRETDAREKRAEARREEKKARIRQSDLDGTHKKKKSTSPLPSPANRDSQSTGTAAAAAPVKPSKRVDPAHSAEGESDEPISGKRLSKSERRRLRKQKRNQHRNSG